MSKYTFVFVVAITLSMPNGAVRANDDLSARVSGFIAAQTERYERRSAERVNTPPALDRASTKPPITMTLRAKSPMKYGDLVVHHRLQLAAYWFATSEARASAFDSWLRCFGIMCQEISLGPRAQAVKSPPVFAIVTANTIVVVSTSCETIGEAWDQDRGEAEKVFGVGDYATLEVNCGGPVTWIEHRGGPVPNSRVNPTVRSVTVLASASTAPARPAGYARR